MTRIGIGFVAAIALASAACAGSTRSGKAATRSSGGDTSATAAAAGTGREARPGEAASAPGDATSAGAGTREVEGRVELIDRANNVTVAGTESVGHAFDRLKIDEDTEIIVDGEQATLAEVHPGDEVRASFSGEGDELRVERLEVVSSGE